MLVACTSGSGQHSSRSSPPPTGPTFSQPPVSLATGGNLSAYCQRLASAASRINTAQSKLYSSGGANSVQALQSELHALQAGAPSNISAALAELATGFGAAQQALAHPSQQNNQKLSALQPKLAADAQLVSQYVVNKCPAG
jgi:hypothetical protein